ncbi:MAG TPA: VOC family protein [Pseudonocardiaceae bacterium]
MSLTRQAISDGADSLGWRYVLGTLCMSVPSTSLNHSIEIAAAAVAAGGSSADEQLRVDPRPDRVDLILGADLALAERISTALAEQVPAAVPGPRGRSVQLLEIGIDALDIPAILPFWRAVLAYVGEDGDLADPVGQGPAIWFQQMTEPRPQRNRIHFDVSVPHDEAPARIRAALDAGGVLVSDAHAPAWWVLADAEGNEACVSTWQGRD